MKIYPSPHTISTTKHPKLLDIPVAHIEKEYYPKSITVDIEKDFAIDSQKAITPYEQFDTDKFLIFDNNKKVKKTTLKFKNKHYVYEPKNFTEFAPEEFEFSILIKKKLYYSASRNYDIKIGVHNFESSGGFGDKIMPLFGDAPYRGVAPANVLVNGGSRQTDDLSSTSTDRVNDFYFIKTSDGKHESDSGAEINVDYYMNRHTNLWLVVPKTTATDMFTQLKESEKDGVETYKTTFHTRDVPYITTFEFGKDYGFKISKSGMVDAYPDSTYKYHQNDLMENSPLYIIEKPNGGYIIISKETLFDHPDKYNKLIYNVLVWVFLRSYKNTNVKKLWITNQPVDYIGSINTPFNRVHEQVNIKDLIDHSGCLIDAYDTLTITLTKKDILFRNCDENGYLTFSKLVANDPEKKDGETSIFTMTRNVMMFSNPDIQTIESKIPITTSITDDNKCYIFVGAFYSSKHRLVHPDIEKLEIKDIDKEYILYALPVDSTDKSKVALIRKDSYVDGSGVVLAHISVVFEGKESAYDVRILGGGLPGKYVDHEMFDIGNLKGRPYRVGTGAVIELPKAYEKYKDRILDTVNTYKVAGDAFYLRFDK